MPKKIQKIKEKSGKPRYKYKYKLEKEEIMAKKEKTPWISFEDWQAEKAWRISKEKKWLSISQNALAISKVFKALEKSMEEQEISK